MEVKVNMAKNKAVPGNVGRPVKLFERDIRNDRKVSRFHLDRDTENQADVFGYWSDLKPKAKTQVDNAALELEIKTGEKFGYFKDALDGGVDAKGNKKVPTDTSVINAITTDEGIIELKRDLIQKQEYLGLIESAIKTMDQRRSSLKILESLNHDQYFDSQGKASDEYNGREARKNQTQDAKNKLKDGLSKLDIPEDEDTETVIKDETLEEEVEIEEDTDLEDTVTNDDTGTVESAPKDSEEETVVTNTSPEENGCPFKHTMGVDFGSFDECDECDMESDCFRASKKL